MPADLAERIIADVFSGGGGRQAPATALLVVGESGAGRTRLVRRLAAGAPEGVPVVAVTARPGREVPSWTVRELVRRLAELPADRAAPAEAGESAPARDTP